MDYVERYFRDEDFYTADEAAKALAKGYAGLCLLRHQYKNRLNTNHHYSKDDAYYLMTQGAHEETARVQTSGPTDGVARAVANVDSFLARLNREADEEFRKSVIQPYSKIAELTEIFEICLKPMEPWMLEVAKMRYRYRRPRTRIQDAMGKPMKTSLVEKAEKAILERLTVTLTDYKKYCLSGGTSIQDETAAKVIAEHLPDYVISQEKAG
ncbi:MAG: hypothetical protein LUE86_12185 [Clostridiales bacterium]|nr:hypothetical protein [Clostridiales bacterium]